jgi:steroid 5-alpha reductase family enzyme
MVDQIIQSYQALLLPMLVWALGWYLLSLIIQRNDFVDVAWGIGFVYIIFWQSFQTKPGLLQFVVNGLISLWGLRLGIYLLVRNAAKPQEDWRYLKWRKEWGRSFYWRSFLQVYVLQTILMLIISIPIVLASISTSTISIWMLPGMLLWCIGFYWQVVGDQQLKRFKSKAENKGHFIQAGLWAKSRHPNYFGEICMWWGIWLVVLPLTYGWLGIVSPLLITYLLLKVSGVPMLERKYVGNSEFEDYQRRVPAVFPKLF